MSQSPVKPPLPAVAGAINIPNSSLAHHNYTWAQQSSVSFLLASHISTFAMQHHKTTVYAEQFLGNPK